MIKMKKIVAAFSALTMVITSMMAFSSLTVNAAAVPTATVKVSYPAGTVNVGDNVKIDCYFEGLDDYTDWYFSSWSFDVVAKTNTETYAADEYLDFASAIGSVEGNITTTDDNVPTAKLYSATKKTALRCMFSVLSGGTAAWQPVKNGLVGSFTVPIKKVIDTDVALVVNNVSLVMRDDQATSANYKYVGTADVGNVSKFLTAPTATKTAVEVAMSVDSLKAPAPSETIPTATEATPVSDGTLANWPANAATATAIGGTYVSDTDPSDTAVAYGVGLKGTGDDVTRTKVIWKVVANGETKGHEMILNTGIAGAGTAKVGLAIQGLTADEVTSVQAAFGN